MSSALKLMATTCCPISATSSPGKETTAAPVSEVSTATPSLASNSSDCSTPPVSRRSRTKANIVWDDLSFGAQIEPLQRHAKNADDIYLLNTFLELSKVTDVDACAVKLVLQALMFLRGCSYSSVDICSILAHASAYFADVYALCGDFMGPSEVANVLVTAMFVAHSYTQDETCPLRVWHQYLFKRYCSLKGVSAASMRIMSIRGYVLRLPDDELAEKNKALWSAIGSPMLQGGGGVELVC